MGLDIGSSIGWSSPTTGANSRITTLGSGKTSRRAIQTVFGPPKANSSASSPHQRCEVASDVDSDVAHDGRLSCARERWRRARLRDRREKDSVALRERRAGRPSSAPRSRGIDGLGR
ncbi:hypothetical protein NL676_002659 [Syzygium grande]|nr:hypothetical protein NL676_002659 [Syzygium grande]